MNQSKNNQFNCTPIEDEVVFSKLFLQNSATELKSFVKSRRFTAVEQVLDSLLGLFESHLIVNLRFYAIEKFAGRRVLVSVASSGHDFALSRRFKSGAITREFVRESESTLCFSKKTPVVFIARSSETNLVECGMIESKFPIFEVHDTCGVELGRKGSRLYVDFPLYSSGECFGKFSCDFCTLDTDLVSKDSLFRCWSLAQASSSVLASIIHSTASRTLRRGVKRIRHSAGFSELDAFESYMEDELLLNEGSISYFSVVTDSISNDGNPRSILTLARSTSPTLKKFVRTNKAYPSTCECLVPVAANVLHSLRFGNVANPLVRQEQCKRYGIPIRWYDDHFFGNWEGQRSILTVPVKNALTGTVTGLYLLTRSLSSMEDFTYADERAANLLINSVFAKIDTSKYIGSSKQNPNRYAEFAYDLFKRDASKPVDTVLNLLSMLAPETEGSKKLYGVCGTSEHQLFVHGSRGKLQGKDASGRSYKLEASITLEAIRCHPIDIVFRTVPEQRKSIRQLAEQNLPYTTGAACELACAFANSEGKSVGAILLKSDWFDLDPAELGPYLRILSTWLTNNSGFQTTWFFGSNTKLKRSAKSKEL